MAQSNTDNPTTNNERKQEDAAENLTMISVLWPLILISIMYVASVHFSNQAVQSGIRQAAMLTSIGTLVLWAMQCKWLPQPRDSVSTKERIIHVLCGELMLCAPLPVIAALINLMLTTLNALFAMAALVVFMIGACLIILGVWTIIEAIWPLSYDRLRAIDQPTW